ncbi:hypothetical protein [Propioniciclava soli]|uniref:hypothetical protein n=1 Tax=Propioniciclava soli TaxID=2775081 RepID=UPI001E565E9F|nr:hypothetical protein [Propioniciclava soli]
MVIDLAGLSDDLVARLIAWNSEYQVIVPLDLRQRRSLARSIERLDARGIALADEIERALAPANVTYYSEGWLRNL